jgi:urease accessory protein
MTPRIAFSALPVSLICLAAATPALAHVGHGHTTGFASGLVHPILGTDHLLAMLAVGLWSGFVLSQRVWLGAAVFLAAMATGAAASWAGLALPLVETGIVASVVLFGLLTMLSARGQSAVLTRASLGLIAVFALLHGHAHASEAAGNALAYLAGFLVATAGLHLAGIGLARVIADNRAAQGAMGTAIAASGLWLSFA